MNSSLKYSESDKFSYGTDKESIATSHTVSGEIYEIAVTADIWVRAEGDRTDSEWSPGSSPVRNIEVGTILIFNEIKTVFTKDFSLSIETIGKASEMTGIKEVVSLIGLLKEPSPEGSLLKWSKSQDITTNGNTLEVDRKVFGFGIPEIGRFDLARSFYETALVKICTDINEFYNTIERDEQGRNICGKDWNGKYTENPLDKLPIDQTVFKVAGCSNAVDNESLPTVSIYGYEKIITDLNSNKDAFSNQKPKTLYFYQLKNATNEHGEKTSKLNLVGNATILHDDKTRSGKVESMYEASVNAAGFKRCPDFLNKVAVVEEFGGYSYTPSAFKRTCLIVPTVKKGIILSGIECKNGRPLFYTKNAFMGKIDPLVSDIFVSFLPHDESKHYKPLIFIQSYE